MKDLLDFISNKIKVISIKNEIVKKTKLSKKCICSIFRYIKCGIIVCRNINKYKKYAWMYI
jgi:hypothetical protein